jgi:hypothetical protein
MSFFVHLSIERKRRRQVPSAEVERRREDHYQIVMALSRFSQKGNHVATSFPQ